MLNQLTWLKARNITARLIYTLVSLPLLIGLTLMGLFVDYPVYYTYPTAVRFIRSIFNNEYSPKTLALFTKQLVGPIPKQAVKINAYYKNLHGRIV
jgi:hypothetical protein